ncbi:FMN-binding protein [Vibrio sp. YIC-376]|uniref:FMN-binding protein n=1 Tax=Vibrio sp. YIC-376 TaxID=3136162 RepID=UPI00402B0095
MKLKRILSIFSWISLAVAFVVGLIWQQPDYPALLHQAYPDTEVTQLQSAQGPQFLVTEQNGNIHHVSLGEAYGYGGPMLVAIEVSDNDKISNIKLVKHAETPGYLARFYQGKFFSQYLNRKVNEPLVLGEDIDGVSGATFTSRGMTASIRSAAHSVAKQLKLSIPDQESQWQFGYQELAVIVLFIAAASVKLIPGQWRSYYQQLLAISSVLFIGYIFNTALSISSVGALLLGYFPPLQDHLLWYILLVGALGSIVFLGKNLYCSFICPFHYIQRWLHKISQLNLEIPNRLKRNLKTWVNGLLWLSLMMIFLSRTPAIGSYEPFSMLFSLDGIGIQWYILPLSLFGSLLVNNFWCRLFCPLGRFLNTSLEARNKTLKRYQRIPVRNIPHDQTRQKNSSH